MPIDRVTLVVSDTGFPAPHAASHEDGGPDELTLAMSQIQGLGTIAAYDFPAGPFSNDAAAASGGVLVGKLYYTPSGIVHIRLS
jgi:hypothetical protein